jgi:arsenate reductase (glutaredoxin)
MDMRDLHAGESGRSGYRNEAGAHVAPRRVRMALTVYGIPTCGTVRKARAWLDEHGTAYTFVDFRESPPRPERVAAWVAALGARAMRNTSGGSYRALGPEKDTWDDAAWARAFAADPMLIKRPIIERDGLAVAVGFKGGPIG